MSLDADTRQLLALRIEMKLPMLQDLTPAQAREAMAAARAAANVEPPPIGEVQAASVAGPGGPIALRVYRPDMDRDDDMLPALIFLHGGGWVLGDLDSHDILCRQLANAARCAVIAVDYRLAPEHKFPAAIDDAEAALRHVFANVGTFGIDPARVAVGGDSTGGNIAAVMAIRAARGDLPGFCFQLLAYPCIDLTMTRRSYDVAAEGLPVTADTMFWFRDHYLCRPEDQVDWRTSPLFAPRLAGVAPAYILAAGYDPLLDEGDAYARRLRQAGVAVTYRVYPGQIHGFLTLGAMLPTAAKAIVEIGEALRSALAAPRSETVADLPPLSKTPYPNSFAREKRYGR